MTDATVDKRIVSKPHIVSGKPHIAGRRITVQNIVIWHEFMGKSADEIAYEYDLTLPEIYLALAYYYDHRAEIDQAIRDDEQFILGQRAKTVSKMK